MARILDRCPESWPDESATASVTRRFAMKQDPGTGLAIAPGQRPGGDAMNRKNSNVDRPDEDVQRLEQDGRIPKEELAGHLRDVVSAAKCIATLVDYLATKIDSRQTPIKEEVKG